MTFLFDRCEIAGLYFLNLEFDKQLVKWNYRCDSYNHGFMRHIAAHPFLFPNRFLVLSISSVFSSKYWFYIYVYVIIHNIIIFIIPTDIISNFEYLWFRYYRIILLSFAFLTGMSNTLALHLLTEKIKKTELTGLYCGCSSSSCSIYCS